MLSADWIKLYLTSEQWNVHMPDAMLDTEEYKGELADGQSYRVWTLFICVNRKRTRMKNIFIYF